MDYKACIKCGLVKLLTEFYFNRQHDAYDSSCKVCRKERVKQWRQNNPQAVRRIQKRYRVTHPDKVREAAAAWSKRNPESRKAAITRYRQTTLKLRRLANSFLPRKTRPSC